MALLWPLMAWWTWDQPGTDLVDTTAEGAVLASVRSVDVGSGSHCSDGNDCIGHCSGLCSLGLRGVSQPLWWRARQVMAILWHLNARWTWDQPGTVEVDTTDEGAILATIPSVDLDTGSHCVSGHHS